MKDNVKKILSIVLGVALLVSIIPVALLVRNGGEESVSDVGATSPSYISLPITIRDFAADGMLFEYNERGAKGQTDSSGTPAKAFFHTPTSDRCSWSWPGDSYTRYFATGDAQDYMTIAVNLKREESDFAVLRFRASSQNTGSYGGSNTPVIVQRNNSTKANKVGPHNDGYFAGPIVDKDAWNVDHSVTWKDYFGQGQEWQYVFLKLRHDTATSDKWEGTKNSTVTHITIYPKLLDGYFDFGGIWVFGSADNARAFIKNGYHAGGITYNNADTLGFGMLLTNEADSYNILTDKAIGRSHFWNNGKWGDTAQPSTKNDTLYTGVTQKVQGAIIRSNLVYDELAPNGKPLYTRQAVCFLARYMQKVMKTRWAGANNTLNLGFVQGQELAQLGGTDLAERLRNRAQNDKTNYEFNTATSKAGISDEVNDMYTDAKARWLAGELDDYTDVHNWLDAAFYLLHNTWIDSSKDQKEAGSDGYGMKIDNYHTLKLVQKTDGGKTYYVFNSAYDKASYNAKTGVIQNNQTSTITGDVGEDGKVLFLRGNKLPKNRFDPLGKSYSNGVGVLGYGLSGDTTHDQLNQVAQWGSYYKTTNYNLSLEGHGKFIYYEDADQYFTFTGDDDVYLYINGKRVMDMGAAHSISKVTINLKDAATKCGLVDGQVYDFDFFYMERHGTAANFGIETNIQVVDPSMTTTKTGYQNGMNTGYNGYVDPSAPVVYDFALQNMGGEKISDLTFTDADIGTTLTKSAITLNSETKIGDLSVTLYNPDGSVKSYVPVGSLTDAVLKQYLTTGLKIGEKIEIYGFKYTIPADKWETRKLSDGTTSNHYFYNQVYTTAKSATGQDLSGTSHWVVQKQKADYEDIHLYTWGNMDTTSPDKTKLKDGGSVQLLRSELETIIKNADKNATLTGSEAIKISNATGITDTSQTTNINSKAKVSGSTITYQATNTGADTYYVMVGTHGPIRVTVFTYGVADSAFVLDYNLPVTFTKDLINSNSVFDLASQNPIGTTNSVTWSNLTTNYGTLKPTENGDLVYTMNQIMNGVDSMTGTVTVLENGETEVTKFTGVTMPKTITVVPASVMYYEDNFIGKGALTYQGAWTQFGSGLGYQSADQNSPYGSDPNYSMDKIAPSGLRGDASNGTIRVHTVQDQDQPYELMSFTFQGTGFEILSRTTDLDYAVLNVEVYKAGTAEPVKRQPVICESANGDLYQVPVLAVKDLDYGTYTVKLSVSYNGTTTNTPKAYIDGVRIYSPLNGDLEQLYYNSNEAKATVTEVKKLIKDGKIVYAAKASDSKYILASGDTAIENYDGTDGFVLKENVDLNTYLNFGPNNELYLDGQNDGYSVIAFYVTVDPNYADAERTIQIGVHRKTDSKLGNVTYNTDSVTLVYGSNATALTNGYYSTTIQSGTEQYYTIDVANLTQDAHGRYLVIIGMSSNNNNGLMPVLSITNLKISGYEISGIDFDLQSATQNG